jgi:hypothetical protein
MLGRAGKSSDSATFGQFWCLKMWLKGYSLIQRKLMKRSGTILLCLACGMALSAIARADNAPSPAGSRPDTAHQGDAAQRKQELQRRIEELKKKIRAKNPGINITMPGGPTAGTTASAPAPGVTPSNPAPAQSVPADNMQGNPYASIVTRNVFGLNPPPPPVADVPQGAPPPKITLTGITTIFGPAEALYKVSGVPQAGKPPKDESYILKEGEQQDDVAVQHIDVAKGIVTFKNHDVVQDIPLVAGVASGGSPAPSGGGGGFQPPRAAGFGGRPNIPNFNNLPPNIRARLEQRFGNGAFNNQNGNNNFNAMGQYNNNNYNSANPNTTGLSSEDNEALIAAQKAQLQSQGKPEWQIYPETPSFNQARTEAGGNTPNP